jgi:hypothetical protein
MFSFDPLTVGGGFLLWQMLKKNSSPTFGALTPEREEMFRNALEHLQDPERLNSLAEAFEKEGLKAQGAILRRRAVWRARNTETKAAHEAIFQKALKSENVEAILDVARAFEAMTATNKASQLRERVQMLKNKAAMPAVVVETTAEEKSAEKPAEPAEKPVEHAN